LNEPFASIIDVTYIYGDGTKALENITLEIHQGDRIGLAGENGSGKTTLCKHMNGLLSPTYGQVSIDGKNITEIDILEIVRQVGFLFQNPDNQLFCSKVTDEISFGLRNIGLNEDEIAARVKKYLKLLGIERHADSPPLMLSMGLRRLVTIASTLAMEPSLVILDEPTAWLDGNQTSFAINAINAFAENGGTIIVVTHNMKLLAELTDRTIILSQGRKIADGKTREMLSDMELLTRARLSPTPLVELSTHLGLADNGVVITEDDFVNAMRKYKGGGVSLRS